MLSQCLLILGLAACLPASVLAERLDIPLPELRGIYGAGGQRSLTMSFNLEARLDTVLGAWVRWSGVMMPGRGQGGPVCGDSTRWFDWPTQLVARVDPYGPGFGGNAWLGPLNGPFSDTTAFGPSPWTAILDGNGTIQFVLVPAFIECATMVDTPQVTVTDAGLILDVIRSAVDVGEPRIPGGIWLSPPAPNPMRERTVLTYRLPSPGYLRIDVVDALGRIVRRLASRPAARGPGSVEWDRRDDGGRRLAAGLYFCRLSIGEAVIRRKLVALD